MDKIKLRIATGIATLFATLAIAQQTLPPSIVKLKGATDGTPIGNVSDALKVNVVGGASSPDVNVHDAAGNPINSTGTSLNVNVTNASSSTVTQGPGGLSPWLVNINNTPIPVTGTFFQTTQPVSGTFFQSVQPVSQSGSWSVLSAQSGTWTTGRTWNLSFLNDKVDASGSSVSVSNFPATQPVSGTVTANQGTSPWVTSVSNFPSTFGVTQSTSPWLVSRNWTESHSTDSIQSWLFDGTGNSLGSTGGALNVAITSGAASNASIGLNGATAPTSSTQAGARDLSGNLQPLKVNAAGALLTDSSATTQPVSGTFFQATQPVSGTFFQATQPVSGTVTSNQGTSPWVTSVSNFPATQPVSGTVTANQGTSPWVTSVSNFPATQAVTQSTSPWVVSGTVTSNIGTTNGLALDTTLSSLSAKFGTLGQKLMAGSAPVVIASDQSAIPVTGTFFQSIQPVSQSGSWTVLANQGTSPWVTSRNWTLSSGTDSVNVGNFPSTFGVTQSTSPWVVSGTVTANAGTGTFLVDGSAHTQPVSGTVTANAGTGTFNVAGTVTANAGTGNFTVVQPTGTNLHVVVDSAPTTTVTGSVSVSNFPATQAVSGTVTANQGTSPWVDNVTQFAGTAAAMNYGTAANALRTAAQVGNASGVADFNAGATSAQTLRTASNAYDGAGNAETSSTFNSKTGASTIASGQDIQTVTGTGSALNGDAIAATDVAAYRDISLQIVVTGTNTTTFQASNDNFTTVFSTNCQTVASGATAAVQTTAATILVHCPVKYRYFRARVTAFTSGSSAGTMILSPLASTTDLGARQTAGTTTVSGTVNTNPAVQTFGAQVASAAHTTTGVSAVVTQGAPNNNAVFELGVTAVSGTNPTLDLAFQESPDNGTTWFDVWHFERVTATTVLYTPNITIYSTKFRFSWTIGGTTPSFTFVINSIQGTGVGLEQNRFFDRTISLTTANSTSASWNTDGCLSYTITLNQSACTTFPTLAIQSSENNSDWANTLGVLATTANGTAVSTTSQQPAHFSRIITTTAGTTCTLGYVALRCTQN